MSSDMNANAAAPGNLSPPTQLHKLALFGDTAEVRANARRQIRSNSAFGPDFWKTLDGAFQMGYLGVRPSQNDSVRANAQLFDYDEFLARLDNTTVCVVAIIVVPYPAVGGHAQSPS